MKKLMIRLGLVVALSMLATSGFAAATQVVQTVIGGGSFSPSNNVAIWCTSTGTVYTAASGHLNGDRILGGSNSDPKIYYKAKTAGTALVAADVPADFTSGWTSI